MLQVADWVKWTRFMWADTFCLKFKGKLLKLFLIWQAESISFQLLLNMFSYNVSLNKALWKVISVFCFVFVCVLIVKQIECFLLERAESLFWSECYLKLVNILCRCEVSTLHSLEGLDCRSKNIGKKYIYSPWDVTLHSLPSLTLLRCLTDRCFNVLNCSWFGTRSLLEMLKILALGLGTPSSLEFPMLWKSWLLISSYWYRNLRKESRRIQEVWDWSKRGGKT